MPSGFTSKVSFIATRLSVVLSTVALALGAIGCAEEPATLADALPRDGDLGERWLRVSEPRTEAASEASTICGVQLNAGMTEGVKLDLADDREDFVSMFFRRYDDAATAEAALRAASRRIAACPPGGVDLGERVSMRTIPDPGVGDASFGAVFTVAGSAAQLPSEFGWALVQTGDVVRSLQFYPVEPRTSTATDLRDLARAVAATP